MMECQSQLDLLRACFLYLLKTELFCFWRWKNESGLGLGLFTIKFSNFRALEQGWSTGAREFQSSWPDKFYVFKLWARWVRGRGRGGTWAHGRRLALRTAKSVCWTQTRSKEWLLLQQENMSAVGSGGAVCGETSRASRRIFQRSNTWLSALCSELALKSAPPPQHTLSLFSAWKPNFRGGRLTSAVDCFMPYFLSSECPWRHHHDLIWSQELEKQIMLPYGGWPAGP